MQGSLQAAWPRGLQPRGAKRIFTSNGCDMDSPIETGTQTRADQEIQPFQVGARLRIAAEYIKGQRFKEALPLAEEAVKLEPNNALWHT